MVGMLAVIFGLVLAAAMPTHAKNLESGYFGFMTNDTVANSVVVFVTGTNELAGTFPTGGSGSGVELGSQGSLATTDDGKYIIAVNAGSGDVSVFRVKPDKVEAVGSPVASGGTKPISVTVHDDVVYVLNAGGVGNIAGFHLHHGVLTMIPGSLQPLTVSAATSKPVQVLFDKTGEWLVVPQKGINTFSVYHVEHGVAGPPMSESSVGPVPFGAMFDKHNNLLVSEAGLGGASSYHLDTTSGALTPISSSVVNGQVAACWLVGTKQGDVYTANTASNDVSLYDDDHGVLTLVAGNAAMTGAHPLDMAVAGNKKNLYVLTTGGMMVDVFAIDHDGALTYVTSVSGVKAYSAGMVAN